MLRGRFPVCPWEVSCMEASRYVFVNKRLKGDFSERNTYVLNTYDINTLSSLKVCLWITFLFYVDIM